MRGRMEKFLAPAGRALPRELSELRPSELSRESAYMSRRYIRQFVDGDSLDDVFLLGDKQLRVNRQGNPYLQVEMRDRSGQITARLWNAGENLARQFDTGDFVHARGKVQLYQGGLQVILSQLSPIEGEKFDLADFLPHSEQDLARLQEKLKALLGQIKEPHLKALAEVFLMDSELMTQLAAAPAGVRNHHAYIGGLLEHIVKLLEIGERVLPLYPGLDKDLVQLGFFIHDLGKVRELAFEKTFAYTDEGQLIGHLVIGVELLGEKIAEAEGMMGEPFPRELVLRLKHMIVSHHGSYEFGSPKLPMTPEAVALHALDNFDAKVHSFLRDIREDKNSSSAWTPFNQSLQRKLFKGGEAPAEGSGENDA
jgi:3'-5' exoribonuclease